MSEWPTEVLISVMSARCIVMGTGKALGMDGHDLFGEIPLGWKRSVSDGMLDLASCSFVVFGLVDLSGFVAFALIATACVGS